MVIDDALHRGEADPGAREFRRVVQTLKRLEEDAGMGHVEAAPLSLTKKTVSMP